MKKCPYCGYDNDESVKVCERCRAEIPVKKPEQPKKAEDKKVKE